jgi:tetratricopeptide (TPR) repeat protein
MEIFHFVRSTGLLQWHKMRIKASGLRAAPLCLIVMLLAFGGLSCTVQAQAPADDHSPAELKRQIDELYREGKFREAIPLAEKVVFLTKRAKGEEHPDTATSLNDLAELYEAVGDYTKAEPLYQKALAIRQKVLGPDHPNTATSLENLAVLEFDLGRNKEAEVYAHRAADAQRNLLSRMFSFSSEPQRLAYLATFNPYTVFALLPGCEAELGMTLLRYKGIVLDSVIEDRLRQGDELGRRRWHSDGRGRQCDGPSWDVAGDPVGLRHRKRPNARRRRCHGSAPGLCASRGPEPGVNALGS